MVSSERWESISAVWLAGAHGSRCRPVREDRERHEPQGLVSGDHPTRHGVELVLSPGCGRRRGAPQSHWRRSAWSGRRQGHRPRRRRPLVARTWKRASITRAWTNTTVSIRRPPATTSRRPSRPRRWSRASCGGRATRTRAGAISVACAAGEFAEIQAIEIRVDSVRLRPIADFEPRFRLGGLGEWAPLKDSNTDANICVEANQRSMVFQPVGFRSSATDPSLRAGRQRRSSRPRRPSGIRPA